MNQDQSSNYKEARPVRSRGHYLPLTNAAGEIEEPLPTTHAERE